MIENRFSCFEVKMCQTDEEYVRRCLNGEPEIYRRLVERHEKAVLAFLVGRMGSRDLAEESAQEAFVRAYFSLGKLRKGESFLPWLFGIAARSGQEMARDRKRLPVAGELLEVPARPDAKTSPQEDALSKAVTQLPAVYREAILLRYRADLSCAQMAKDLGIPLGTVTKRLSRAYALLREMLAQPERVWQEGEVES